MSLYLLPVSVGNSYNQLPPSFLIGKRVQEYVYSNPSYITTGTPNPGSGNRRNVMLVQFYHRFDCIWGRVFLNHVH